MMESVFPHPVLVDIEGVTRRARFARLSDAMAAVRTSLARLPLEKEHAAYLAEQFAPESVGRLGDQLARIGAVRAIAFVGMDVHVIYIRPARETGQ
ncbi:hypothetical protein [Kitasatospora sp. NPDC057198]|uniref:hypothetical protein n=1 Tax=Kitasatospora sp. NPDC057198 TaxID=3346046 RepID=UPI003645AFD8